MTREEFIRRWRYHLIGLGVYGVVSETTDGTMKRAARIYELPMEVDKLLAKLYDDAQPLSKTLPPKQIELPPPKAVKSP